MGIHRGTLAYTRWGIVWGRGEEEGDKVVGMQLYIHRACVCSTHNDIHMCLMLCWLPNSQIVGLAIAFQPMGFYDECNYALWCYFWVQEIKIASAQKRAKRSRQSPWLGWIFGLLSFYTLNAWVAIHAVRTFISLMGGVFNLCRSQPGDKHCEPVGGY